MTAECALRLTDVHKSFASHGHPVPALAGVSLAVGPGEIAAVVGHNGAGKTTLLRLIAGLARPDRGAIEIWGTQVPDARDRACLHTGCSIEGSGFIGGLTGLANLELLARRHGLGGPPAAQLVRDCGLSEQAALRPYSTYSLGMRQRLGLAAALLGGPRLLILDEPTNGLDPAGIAWMREVLRAHAARGGAALVSSHLLDEVERLAHTIVILHRGRVARAGSLANVLHDATAQVTLHISGSARQAVELLHRAEIPTEMDGGELTITVSHHRLPEISLVLASAGIGVTRMVPTVSQLEMALRDLEHHEP